MSRKAQTRSRGTEGSNPSSSTSESIANLTGLDWTQKYLAIVEAAESLPATQAAYLDGELCGMRSDGTTSFSMIQAASDAG